MAVGVMIDDEVVSARLDRLIELVDQVDTMKSDLQRVRTDLTNSWPAIPSVQDFVTQLRTSLDLKAGELAQVQTTIGQLHQALLDSTRSLQNLDQDVQDRLQRLADRLPPEPSTAIGLGGLGPGGASTPRGSALGAPRAV